MTSFVALLRGINVGGYKAVSMTALRELGESLGFAEVATLLQSGNLIFKAKDSNAGKIEADLAKAAEKKFGHRIDFFVRDGKEWKAIMARNPFGAEAADDPSHLVVMCLRDKPGAKALDLLKAAIKGREYFHAEGRGLYLVYPDGVGRSKLTGALIEAKLGTSGTGRNWNTVRKIGELLGSCENAGISDGHRPPLLFLMAATAASPSRMPKKPDSRRGMR